MRVVEVTLVTKQAQLHQHSSLEGKISMLWDPLLCPLRKLSGVLEGIHRGLYQDELLEQKRVREVLLCLTGERQCQGPDGIKMNA